MNLKYISYFFMIKDKFLIHQSMYVVLFLVSNFNEMIKKMVSILSLILYEFTIQH